MREQKASEKGSFFFFFNRTRKARNAFRGLKCHVSGKRGGFVKICPNSLDSSLFRGQIWNKIPQIKSLFGVEFCILTKMCLGVYFKIFVQACVHMHMWVPPYPQVRLIKDKGERQYLVYLCISDTTFWRRDSPMGVVFYDTFILSCQFMTIWWCHFFAWNFLLKCHHHSSKSLWKALLLQISEKADVPSKKQS